MRGATDGEESFFAGREGVESVGSVRGVRPRPLKTMSSLDALEDVEDAGEGLRMVIWARASVATGDGDGCAEGDADAADFS